MNYKNNQKLIEKGERIRVRMAPSPTGALHVGTARTALFNYLFAKHYGGKFILRIEDTDKERSKKEWEINILDGLKWLGISWDELYKQSERTKTYKTYLEKLLKEDKAFYCWHTLDELQKEQSRQITKKEAPLHICEQRNEKNINKKKIERSIIRLKNNSESKIIGNLHYYLSLNPHEAEYKGMVFTNYDAKFVLHAVTGLISNILKHIENDIKT